MDPALETNGGGSLRDHGAAYLKQGRFAEAVETLTDVVQFEPNDESSWRLLGGALASQGDYPKSVEAFRRAVELVPSSAKNHYNLGVALQGAGSPEEARASLEKSLALDPGYAQARTRLDDLSGRTAPAPAVSPPSGPSTLGGIGAGGLGTVGGPIGNVTPPPAPPSVGGGMPGLSSIGGGGLGAIGGGQPETVTENGRLVPPGSVAPAPLGGGPVLREPTQPAAPSPYGVASSGGGGLGAYAPNPVLGMVYGNPRGNTSGMQGEVPAEAARGFNLGAAVITFWWLRNHNLRNISWMLAMSYFVLRMIGRFTGNAGAWVILILIQIGMFLVMGFFGNRLAWQNRTFDDVEDFKACQRIWMYWAIPLFVLQVCLYGVTFFAAFAAQSMTSSGAFGQ